MTARERAVGQVVEWAMRDLAREGNGVRGEWATVADIADITGLSKPTVRKYLVILVANGLVIESPVKQKNEAVFYRWGGFEN